MSAPAGIVAAMKRYGQRCPAAIALDVVGERWTPLIVRELLLGPKRFTDLTDGLPGIGTNILTNRLASLQEHGVVERHTLPRPTPVAVYELTDAGRALAPVLRELRAWGARFGPAPHPGTPSSRPGSSRAPPAAIRGSGRGAPASCASATTRSASPAPMTASTSRPESSRLPKPS